MAQLKENKKTIKYSNHHQIEKNSIQITKKAEQANKHPV